MTYMVTKMRAGIWSYIIFFMTIVCFQLQTLFCHKNIKKELCSDAIDTKAKFEKEKGWTKTIYLKKQELRAVREN